MASFTYIHLGIYKVLDEAAIRLLRDGGAEPEEYVGRHGVDPEHEGEECVEDEIAKTLTQTELHEEVINRMLYKVAM